MIHPIERDRVITRFQEIPRLALGHYPTPLEKLPRFQAALGATPRIYIKRDDYTGPGFGGNKVRKLEYVLAAATASGADAVITCGGLKSNHCRATAMLAARLGLDCHLVLNRPASMPSATPASLAIDQLVGAKVTLVEDRTQRTPAMERVAAALREQGRNPEIIPVGASSPLGALGYVDAMAELAGQMEDGRLHFDAIFVSSSSGGTHAGIAAGSQLFLSRQPEIFGVSPDDASSSIQQSVSSIIRGIGQRLDAAFDDNAHVLDGFIGEGYGIESEAGRKALELLARTEGILLDPVYTAKTMAALVALAAEGRWTSGQRILFWHTGGQLALFHR